MASYPQMVEERKQPDPGADTAMGEAPGEQAAPARPTASVGKAIAWSQGLSLVRLALSFVFSVVVVRSLAPHEYGLYAFLLSVVATAGIAVSLGFDGVIGRYASSFHALSDSVQFAELIRELVTWRFVLVTVIAVVLWGGHETIAALLRNGDAAPYLQWVGVLLIIQNLRLLLNTIQYAILNTRYAELVAVTERVIALACSVLFFGWFGRNLSAVLIALIVAESVALVLALVPLAANFRNYRLSVQLLRQRAVRSMALNYWGTDLVTYALSAQLAILLISLLLSNNTEIAFYSIGISLISQVSAVAVSSWKNLPLPVLSQARSRVGDGGVSSGWVLFLKLFAVFLIPLMMFMLVSAAPLIHLLYGQEYALSAGVVQINAFFFIAAIPSGTWATVGALYVMDAEHQLFRLRLLTGAANVLLILALVPLLGFWGAAISTSLAVTLSNWTEYFLLRRRLAVPIPWRFLGVIIAICLIGTLASYAVPGESWFILGLRFGLYGICIVLLAFLFKPFEPQEIAQAAQFNGRLGQILQYASRR